MEKNKKTMIGELGAGILIVIMLLMIVMETLAKYYRLKNEFTLRMLRYFYVVGCIMILYVIIYIVMVIKERGISAVKTYFRDNRYDILWLIFLLYAFVAAVFSEDRKKAFFGLKYRGTGFFAYLIFVAAYICGKMIGYQKEKFESKPDNTHNDSSLASAVGNMKKYIYFAFMMVCTFQNLLLIFREMGQFGMKAGAFYNTNHSAYFMVISLFATIGYAALANTPVKKLLGIGLYIVNLWCLIINDTFGAYLAVIVGLVFMSVLHFVKYRKVKPIVVISIILFGVISVWTDYKTNIISKNFGVLSSDTENISKNDVRAGEAGSGRWDLWVKGFDYVKRHPVLGCGPDCMPIDSETGEILMLPHNEYLQYAMEIGIPATFLYIAGLILLLVQRIKRIKSTEESAVYDCAAVAGYCASAFFGVVIFYTAVYYFIFLGMTSAKTEG